MSAHVAFSEWHALLSHDVDLTPHVGLIHVHHARIDDVYPTIAIAAVAATATIAIMAVVVVSIPFGGGVASFSIAFTAIIALFAVTSDTAAFNIAFGAVTSTSSIVVQSRQNIIFSSAIDTAVNVGGDVSIYVDKLILTAHITLPFFAQTL